MPYLLLIIFFLTQVLFAEELRIDLREPTLTEGVLSTEKGGVIEGPNFRIQAQKFVYSKNGPLLAEGDLILEFNSYYLIGSRLEFNPETHEGVIYDARTGIEPWYFGGQKVLLNFDGSITLQNGFITTSENREMDWLAETCEATLIDRQFLEASDVYFRIRNIPVFWLPCFRTNLDTIFDAPIRYSFRWGGHQGARVSMIYEIFSWDRLKTFFRLDYRIKRGFGGGLETYYRSEDHKEIFNTVNYVANDNSLSNQHERYRYRFQGLYHNQFVDDKVSLDLTWDKLSDRDMASDYNDRGIELDTAGRTQLLIRKQEPNQIERFITYVKVNNFQTVNQELPTMEVSWRPTTLGNTGVISTSLIRASYLDFSYSNNIMHRRDYTSTRMELRQGFFRPIPFQVFTVTPSGGFLGIYYGNSPQSNGKFLALLQGGIEAKTAFSRSFSCFRHIVEPYATFEYLSSPTVSPHHHYIFDIEDGWFQSNTLRLGFRNQIVTPSCRPLYADLFTYAFFDTPTIGTIIPKVYLNLYSLTLPTLRHILETAWDFQHGEMDHFNLRTEWTVSDNLAIRGEYRHRSSFAWRKADPTNFILDAFRSERELLHSPLSDRRDTLLTSLFYQFTPNWALFFELRHGWNRKHERSYTEFETDLIGKLYSAWNIKLSYQHREDDDRIAAYFTIGLHKPNRTKCDRFIPCLEF